ncbi:chaplin [Nostoc sp.]
MNNPLEKHTIPVCGNSIDVISPLNPAFGNTCANRYFFALY